MILRKFIDRKEELSFLEEKYKSKKFEFVVIYGRRRVGKTELIKQFIKDKDSFYFLAKKQDLSLELERFSKKFSKKFNTFIEADSYENLFENILNFFGKNKRFVIIVDEFSYWLERDNTVTSTLQVITDEILKDTRCFVILCGSLVGMMESLFSYKNPLYGRRTGQWKLDPLKFSSFKEFFPRYDLEDLIKAYACTDGIPEYILEFDASKDIMKNITNTFFRKGNVLYEDAERILGGELREPITYLNIMQCINEGATTLSEISTKSKVNITNILKYLKTLTSMKMVTKEFPINVTERKAKKGIYVVADNYFKFWLKFIYQFKDEIEIGTYDFSLFEKQFNTYLGSIFEGIVKETLISNNENILPFRFQRIGRWWYKDKEIDIVALNEKAKQILFCECKWSDNVNAARILRELKEKARFVDWNNEKRKEHYAIFAKSFKKKIKDCYCLDLKDLKKTYNEPNQNI